MQSEPNKPDGVASPATVNNSSDRPPVVSNSAPNPWLPDESAKVAPNGKTLSTFGNTKPDRKPVEVLDVHNWLEQPFDSLKLLLRAFISEEARNRAFPIPTERIYSVPRRFDLATLFVVSSVFSFIFAGIGHFHISPLIQMFVCFYICSVGACQAVLLGGRAPRTSSIISGGVIGALLLTQVTDVGNLVASSILFVVYFLMCAGTGYLSGALIGGVFLVADRIRQHYAAKLVVAPEHPSLDSALASQE